MFCVLLCVCVCMCVSNLWTYLYVFSTESSVHYYLLQRYLSCDIDYYLIKLIALKCGYKKHWLTATMVFLKKRNLIFLTWNMKKGILSWASCLLSSTYYAVHKSTFYSYWDYCEMATSISIGTYPKNHYLYCYCAWREYTSSFIMKTINCRKGLKHKYISFITHGKNNLLTNDIIRSFLIIMVRETSSDNIPNTRILVRNLTRSSFPDCELYSFTHIWVVHAIFHRDS